MALCSTNGICVPDGTMIFAAAAVATGTTGAPAAAGTLGLEVVPLATGAAEPPALAPVPDVGAGALAVPESAVPAAGSVGFCAAGWLAEAGGGGAIGPVSCAAKRGAHPPTRNNRRACGKRSEHFVIGPLFTVIR
jgi:hypothetical protein